MSDEQQEERQLVSPGKMLKDAREKQGLTQENVADKLHLRLSIIEDLEKDNFETDISATFTRGYIKLYSKMLGLDDQKVIEAYQQMNKQEKEPAKLQSFSQRVARQASDQRLMMITYFVGVVVIALLVLWWWQQSSSNDGPLSLFSSVENATENGVSESNRVDESSIIASNTIATRNGTDDKQNTSVPVDSNAQNPEVAEVINSDDAIFEAAQKAAADAAQNSQQAQQLTNATEDDVADVVATATDNINSTINNSSANGAEPESELEQLSGQIAVQAESAANSIQDIRDSANLEQSQQATDFNSGSALADSGSQASEQLTVNLDDPSDLVLPDPVALEFTFAEACWIQIIDATDNEIAVGVKAKGRVMPVSGVPPFQVTLGAPQFVSIKYAGEPVTMPPYNRGAIAKFSLPYFE